MKISLCCIMKNEEKTIGEFVKNHRDYFDEVLIVDNGSEDSSVSIAVQNGARVIESKESFDLARNCYIENAKNEWMVVLDADEQMLSTDIMNLKKYLSTISEDIYSIIIPGFQYFGDGKWATWYLPRVMRKASSIKYESPIHGSISDSVEKTGKKFGYFYAPFHHFDGLISEEHNLNKRIRNTQLLNEKLRSDPNNIKLLNALESEFSVRKDFVKALSIGKKAIELDKDGFKRAYQRFASICYCAGLYNEAIQYAKKQIELYTNQIEGDSARKERFIKQIDSCSTILVKCYAKMGMKDKAEKIILQNIKKNQNYHIII